MKKILGTFLASILITSCMAQKELPGRKYNTMVDDRVRFLYNMVAPRFIDTTQANIYKGNDSCGAIISTYDNKRWIRSCNPKRWEDLSAGGGSVPSLDGFTIFAKPTSGTGTGVATKTKNLVYSSDTLINPGVPYSALNLGITGAGDKTSLMNAFASGTTHKTISLDENQIYHIMGSYNGQGKFHKFEDGAMFMGSGTVNNFYIDAAPGKQIFDTSLTVTNPLNTVLYASWFGFSPSASAAKNTRAIQRISSTINSLGGGVTLIIDKGDYTVGKETFAGATGKGYSYAGELLFYIHDCTKAIFIEGSGATIKLANGLHFGSFSPTTGLRYVPSDEVFTDYDYAAYPNSFIDVRNSVSLTVQNLILNGNVPNLVIGGRWGDDGVQLPADGIISYNNDYFFANNVTSYQCGRDGIIALNAINDTTIKKPIIIWNCNLDGNVRQALSITGANNGDIRNTKFINTGKTYNAGLGGMVRSSPSAGIDLEPEAGNIRNLVFDNIYVYNNDGAGLLTSGSNVSNIQVLNSTIIGTTTYSLYQLPESVTFNNCTVVGTMTNLGFPTFRDCTLSMDTLLSKNHTVFGTYIGDFGGGGGGIFDHCILDGGGTGNSVYGFSKYYNCDIKRISGYSQTTGDFHGTNTWSSTFGGFPDNPGRTNSKFFGPLYVYATSGGGGSSTFLGDAAQLEPDSLRKSIIGVRQLTSSTFEFKHNTGVLDTLRVGESVDTLRTTDGTATTITTIPSVTNKLARYEAAVLAKDQTTGKVAEWTVIVLIDNTSGTTTVKSIDVTTTFMETGMVAFDPSATVSGTSVLLKVTGGTGATIKWSANIKNPQTL